jgi:hypothetical protein
VRRPSARMTPNTVTAQLVAWTADAAAARQPQFAPPGTPIPCTVQIKTSETAGQDGRQQLLNRYEVIVHDDPGLKLRDRLTWVDGGDLTLTVTGIKPAAGRMRSWVIEAEEVR